MSAVADPEFDGQPDAGESAAAGSPDDGSSGARRLRNGIISIIVFSVLGLGVLVAVPGLHDVAVRLSDVDSGRIALAVVLELLSCLGYVLAFQHVFSRTPWRFAARVAWSELAFGAAVPAGGAGGAAVGAWIYRAKGFALSRFAERAAVLFLLTSAVNAACLAITGALALSGMLNGPHAKWLAIIPTAAGAAAIVGFAAAARLVPLLTRSGFPRRRPRLYAGLGGFERSVRETERLVLRPSLGLLGAIGYLGFDVLLMWVSLRAVGYTPSPAALILGYQIGYLSSIVPVPGGIGVLDGGLIGALLLYGIPAKFAAPAVLLYHAVWLWIPTVLGSIAFVLVRRELGEPLVLRPAPPE